MKITDWLLPASVDGSEGSNSNRSPNTTNLSKDKIRNNENRSPLSLNKSNSSDKMPKDKSDQGATASTSKQGGSRQSSGSGGQGSSKQSTGSGGQGSSKQSTGSGSQGSSKQSTGSGSQGASKQSTGSGSQGASRQSSGSGGQGSGRQSGGGQGSNSANTTSVAGTHSVVQKPDVILPQSKVKVIMKSSPEIDQVGQDVVYLITKATELFIDHITTQTFSVAHKAKNVEYKHLAEMTHKKDNLEFLRDIVPQKMTARAALAEMAKQKALSNKEILE